MSSQHKNHESADNGKQVARFNRNKVIIIILTFTSILSLITYKFSLIESFFPSSTELTVAPDAIIADKPTIEEKKLNTEALAIKGENSLREEPESKTEDKAPPALADTIDEAATETEAKSKGTGRWLNLIRPQSQEKLSVIYKRNGELDKDGYNKICHLMRDIESETIPMMDLRLLDILDGVRAALVQAGIKNPTFVVLAGMDGHKHAQDDKIAASYHLRGQGIDFYIKDVPTDIMFQWMQQVKFHNGVGISINDGSPDWIHLDSRGWVHIESRSSVQ